jgi:hypothetical protein
LKQVTCGRIAVLLLVALSLPLSFASKNVVVHFSDVPLLLEYSRLAAFHYLFFEPQVTFFINLKVKL